MPCTPWDLSGFVDCCPCADGASQDDIDDAAANALADMYVSTCMRWPGCCRVEVRPCAPRCACLCGYCEPCGEYVTLDLWEALCTDRVSSVVSVLVDGVAVPASSWRLDLDHRTRLGRYLVLQDASPWRTDGQLCWPEQNRTLPNGAVGTWSVVADIGADPPADVIQAAQDLACEYLKLCKDPDACNLHDGIQSLTRRDTTINFASLEEGNTGVPTLDRVLTKYACRPADNTRGLDPAPEWSFIPIARPTACLP